MNKTFTKDLYLICWRKLLLTIARFIKKICKKISDQKSDDERCRGYHAYLDGRTPDWQIQNEGQKEWQTTWANMDERHSFNCNRRTAWKTNRHGGQEQTRQLKTRQDRHTDWYRQQSDRLTDKEDTQTDRQYRPTGRLHDRQKQWLTDWLHTDRDIKINRRREREEVIHFQVLEPTNFIINTPSSSRLSKLSLNHNKL